MPYEDAAMMQEHLLMDVQHGGQPPWPPTSTGLEPPPLEHSPMASSMNGVHEFVPPPMDAVTSASGGPPVSGSGVSSAAAAAAAAKKTSSRRNAWGNLSYADLITQAINSTPEKRLTLSQVYEWMVANIPYFKDKGDSNSSAGWKVSHFLF